jgi:hypothetical protein
MRLRLFEIHEQPWFPQFLRDQFVDGLQMILEVTKTYQPIAQLLRKRLEECGSERVLDLCSGAGGPWPSLVRDFQMQGASFMNWSSPLRIAFISFATRWMQLRYRGTSKGSGRSFLLSTILTQTRRDSFCRTVLKSDKPLGSLRCLHDIRYRCLRYCSFLSVLGSSSLFGDPFVGHASSGRT